MTLRFHASLTVCPSDIHKITHYAQALSRSSSDLLAHVLVTPFATSDRSLRLIEGMQQSRGSVVMFDSGGYYVQTGKLSYSALYYKLLTTYKAEPWADLFTLPDHVPTSKD